MHFRIFSQVVALTFLCPTPGILNKKPQKYSQHVKHLNSREKFMPSNIAV